MKWKPFIGSLEEQNTMTMQSSLNQLRTNVAHTGAFEKLKRSQLLPLQIAL